MALRRGGRGLSLALPLALLALYSVQPSGAFDYATSGARSVSADVVADASAYNAVTGGACGIISVTGTCAFTITNKATTPQRYTVTLSSDASNAVAFYAITGGSTVGSGSTTTPSDIAVGGTATLTATINGCPCATRHVYWTIEGSKSGVLNSQELRYHMTIG